MPEPTIQLDRDLLADLERLASERHESPSALLHHLLSQSAAGEPDAAAERRRKTRFLSGLVHELRTPLGSVLMLAELLAENASGTLGAKEVRYVENIHQATSEMLAVIADAGLLNRIEAGRVEVVAREVAAAKLAERLEQHHRRAAEERGLAFDVGLADDAPPALTTDRKHFERILREMVDHALRVTAAGGLVAVRFAAASGGLEVTVRDTGAPVEHEELETVFEPFARSNPRSGRKLGGTGLGLPVARALARLLGGDVTAHSEDGAFAAILELPATPPR